jgi:hypothetical protein
MMLLEIIVIQCADRALHMLMAGGRSANYNLSVVSFTNFHKNDYL